MHHHTMGRVIPKRSARKFVISILYMESNMSACHQYTSKPPAGIGVKRNEPPLRA